MVTTSFFTNRFSLDRLGAISSTVCALHCALCAFAPALLTIAGLGMLVSHIVEWTFALITVILAIAAAIRSYFPCGTWMAPLMLLTGVVVLLAGRFTEQLGLAIPESMVTLAAGCILVGGHLSNLRAFRKQR